MDIREKLDVSFIEQPSKDRFYCGNKIVLQKMLNEVDLLTKEGIERLILPQAKSFEERIHMREVLIAWLKHINQYRKSKPGLLALTVEIVDMYVYSRSGRVTGSEVTSLNYQCIGAAAYLISSKLDEVAPVTADELFKFTSEYCSISEITDMEVIISFQLDFNLKYLTPIDFIYFLTDFTDLSESRKTLLRNSSSEIYLSVISESNLKNYLCHIIAINSIILGYHELEDFSDKEMREIVNVIIDSVNPEKVIKYIK